MTEQRSKFKRAIRHHLLWHTYNKFKFICSSAIPMRTKREGEMEFVSKIINKLHIYFCQHTDNIMYSLIRWLFVPVNVNALRIRIILRQKSETVKTVKIKTIKTIHLQKKYLHIFICTFRYTILIIIMIIIMTTIKIGHFYCFKWNGWQYFSVISNFGCVRCVFLYKQLIYLVKIKIQMERLCVVIYWCLLRVSNENATQMTAQRNGWRIFLVIFEIFPFFVQ